VTWLVRPVFGKLARDARSGRDLLMVMLDRLGPTDQEILADEDFRLTHARSVTEAFRQGGRGVAQDYTIEARPWGLELHGMTVPIDIWHGEDDRLVSADASRILAKAITPTTTHFKHIGCGFWGWTQHSWREALSLVGEVVVAVLTEVERVEVWDRWQAGESNRSIGRRLGRLAASIRAFVEASGGVRPAVR
jgi:hypothetical protein